MQTQMKPNKFLHDLYDGGLRTHIILRNLLSKERERQNINVDNLATGNIKCRRVVP